MTIGTGRNRPPDASFDGLWRSSWFAEIYRTAVGKKYVMAVTGLVLMAYVLVHMIGNLKLYFGPEPINAYGEWLRNVGEPVLPRNALLWAVRAVLLVAVALHVHAAVALTLMNRRARPQRYRGKRDYVAAGYASRTMRWSGVIIGLFVVFHLLDLTWGAVTPGFAAGDIYGNVVASFRRWAVAVIYIVANLALGLHLYHGAWSLFQSMGSSSRRFNHWRRYFARAFAVLVTVGNVSFPIAVLAGIVG